AGPRYLMTFDVPRGAIELGADFAALPDRLELARSGLIAQVFGYLALGMTDSSLGRSATLTDRFPDDPTLALLGPDLNATLLLFSLCHSYPFSRAVFHLPRAPGRIADGIPAGPRPGLLWYQAND